MADEHDFKKIPVNVKLYIKSSAFEEPTYLS